MKQDHLTEDLFGKKQQSDYPVIKKGRAKLTAAQSEFNRLNKKIALLRDELNQLPEKQRRISEFYKENILPLRQEYSLVLFKTLCKLDQRYEKKEFNDDDQHTLSGIILNKCDFLDQYMRELGEEDQKKLSGLINKYEQIHLGLSPEELVKEKLKEMLSTFTSMTGMKPTTQMKKAKTEEELSKLIEDFLILNMEEENTVQDETDTFQDTYRKEETGGRQRRMTQTELKRKIQEEKTQKSMRTIYMELAKVLHPDREQDESLRSVKEEQMKLLTEAYKKKDLAALLTMQISWVEKSVNAASGKLSDEMLKGYNKVLKVQLAKLREEEFLTVYSMPDLPEDMGELLKTSMRDLEMHMNYYLLKEKSSLVDIQKKCKSWNSKRGIIKLIKNYGESEFFTDLFGVDIIEEFMQAIMSDKMKF